jgi:hypothetical protein
MDRDLSLSIDMPYLDSPTYNLAQYLFLLCHEK